MSLRLVSSSLRAALCRLTPALCCLGSGVGCAAQNHAVTSEIQVSAEGPVDAEREATDGRQLPTGGAWWDKPRPCPDGARLRTLSPAEQAASGADLAAEDAATHPASPAAAGYRCELAGGVAHGASTVWWPSGKLREHGHYLRGAKDGAWTRYAETGELQARESYRGDVLSGRAQRYSKGVLVEDASYAGGQLNGVQLKYYASGSLEERASYVAGVQDGEFESLEEDGSLSARGTYRRGVQDGEWEICGDGECTRARFEHGAQAGIWEVRDRAGVMLRTEDYTVPDQLTRIDYCQGHPCKRTVFVRR